MSVITESCFTGDAVKREAWSEETNVAEKNKNKSFELIIMTK